MPRSRDPHAELPVDPDVAENNVRGRPLHLHPLHLITVAVGGVAGTLVRFLVDERLPAGSGGWPTATFVVNVGGALLLGGLLEALARRGHDVGWRRRIRLLAGTGFCGALTTYSTFAVEIDLLTRSDDVGVAVGYAVASVFAGLLATVAGIALATGFHRMASAR